MQIKILSLLLSIFLLLTLSSAQAGKEKLQLSDSYSVTLPGSYTFSRNDELSAYYGTEAYQVTNADGLSILLITFPAEGITPDTLETSLLIFQESEWGEFIPEFTYESCQIHKHPAAHAFSEENGLVYTEYFIYLDDVILYVSASYGSAEEQLAIQAVLDII